MAAADEAEHLALVARSGTSRGRGTGRSDVRCGRGWRPRRRASPRRSRRGRAGGRPGWSSRPAPARAGSARAPARSIAEPVGEVVAAPRVGELGLEERPASASLISSMRSRVTGESCHSSARWYMQSDVGVGRLQLGVPPQGADAGAPAAGRARRSAVVDRSARSSWRRRPGRGRPGRRRVGGSGSRQRPGDVVGGSTNVAGSARRPPTGPAGGSSKWYVVLVLVGDRLERDRGTPHQRLALVDALTPAVAAASRGPGRSADPRAASRAAGRGRRC